MLKFIWNFTLITIGGSIAYAVASTFITTGFVANVIAALFVIIGIEWCWDRVTNWFWQRWYQRLLNLSADAKTPPTTDAGNTA